MWEWAPLRHVCPLPPPSLIHEVFQLHHMPASWASSRVMCSGPSSVSWDLSLTAKSGHGVLPSGEQYLHCSSTRYVFLSLVTSLFQAAPQQSAQTGWGKPLTYFLTALRLEIHDQVPQG